MFVSTLREALLALQQRYGGDEPGENVYAAYVERLRPSCTDELPGNWLVIGPEVGLVRMGRNCVDCIFPQHAAVGHALAEGQVIRLDAEVTTCSLPYQLIHEVRWIVPLFEARTLFITGQGASLADQGIGRTLRDDPLDHPHYHLDAAGEPEVRNAC